MEIVACQKVPTFDHIINNIYLGDIVSATDKNCLKNINIIVNISNSRYVEEHDITYYHFDIDDSRGETISQFFDQFDNIVRDSRNKNILVHCANSVSRSVSLVLYYLLVCGMTLNDSIKYLKSKRTQYTKPNIGFFKQLLIAEKVLYGTNSMNVSDYMIL